MPGLAKMNSCFWDHAARPDFEGKLKAQGVLLREATVWLKQQWVAIPSDTGGDQKRTTKPWFKELNGDADDDDGDDDDNNDRCRCCFKRGRR